MTDAPLFGRSQRQRSRAQATDTRSQTAESIRPVLAELQRQVLNFIAGQRGHGATDEEISLGLDMKADTARARRVELRDAGHVHDSGTRRNNKSGRPAIVWVVSISHEMAPTAAASPKPANRSDWPESYPCAYCWGRDRRKR